MFQTHLLEILHDEEPRVTDDRMQSAKGGGVQSLMEHRTFKVLEKQDLLNEANILLVRFVVAMKSYGNCKETYNSRYVIGAQRDWMKSMMVHTSVTLQPWSLRLILGIAVISRFQL